MHLPDHLLLLLVGLLALSHDGQGQTDSHHQEAPGTGEGSPSLKIAPSNTAFAFSFYHLMAAQNPGSNIFFSPLSISTAYAMLSLGARSHTWTQILEGLGFNLTEIPESDIHLGFQHLLRTLNLPDDKLETRVGSALFLSQDVQLLPSFLNDTMTFYESKLFRTNFLDSDGTTQLINNHIKEETRGKIQNLVSRLSTDTVMVLVNYIYFKGWWEKPFNPSKNKLENFYVDQSTSVKVPMMFQDKHHHWYLHDKYLPCSVLRMDYKGNAKAFFILPDQGKMKQVEGFLTPEMLTRWNKLLQNRSFYRKLELHFPKFSISGSYNLDQILPMLGIRDLFSRQANLSGITTERDLLVSRSFHKAVLDVDEAGTEAAAGTSVSVTFLSASFNPRVLWFNRPFLVVIFSTDTNTILFLGKVVNPTKS
ncbi:serpin family A member 4 [Rhinolophus ferrumequinum]|uniref:Serpin family A member 4 n=1 Tax=Rhinolophus ferrumequinum TaxID=59479 RepID=A0A671EJQ3_RHIFE|nr:kallistatin-like [Rhinolophus ferrumequinum]XP_032965291.1 kallistatin-like [Rhinolophus ferrumequinum]KAF6352380.1 serpin family A member 4 [Rhinolophus ferrumequinum]